MGPFHKKNNNNKKKMHKPAKCLEALINFGVSKKD